jgi:hypothetical protein
MKTFVVLVIATIAFVCIIVWSPLTRKDSDTRGTAQASITGAQIITVPVFTDRWTGVPTGGRKFDGHWIIHNGVTLTYLICANTTNVSFEIPSKDGVVLLGPPSDISKLYFMLKPGQGYDKATLQLDLH